MVHKAMATLDVLSEGRVEVGLGAGWLQSDYQAADVPYDPAGVRVDRLEESLRVIKGLFGSAPLSFSGKHYRITALEGLPKPVQRPRPPLLIGGGGRRILSLAGRHADIVDQPELRTAPCRRRHPHMTRRGGRRWPGPREPPRQPAVGLRHRFPGGMLIARSGVLGPGQGGVSAWRRGRTSTRRAARVPGDPGGSVDSVERLPRRAAWVRTSTSVGTSTRSARSCGAWPVHDPTYCYDRNRCTQNTAPGRSGCCLGWWTGPATGPLGRGFLGTTT